MTGITIVEIDPFDILEGREPATPEGESDMAKDDKQKGKMLYLAIQPPHSGWRVKIGHTTQTINERTRRAKSYAPDLEVIGTWPIDLDDEDAETSVRVLSLLRLAARLGTDNLKHIKKEVFEVPEEKDVNDLKNLIDEALSELSEDDE